jgi:hypothetical protein
MKALQPVTSLNLYDMVNAAIEYVYTQNVDGSPDMIETGTIASVKELRDGRIEMYVVPDNASRMTKYRIAETHLVRYMHNETQIENAVA